MTARRVVSTYHTGLTVSDLDRSIAFFRDVLGLPVSDKITPNQMFIEEVTGVANPGLELAYVDCGDHTVELLCFGTPDRAPAVSLQPSTPGFLHIAFVVEDIDDVVAAASAYGIEPINPPTLVESGPRKGWRACCCRDADGIVIELIETA